MKTTLLTALVFILVGLLSLPGYSQTTLADWSFDYAYDQSGTDPLMYTPNATLRTGGDGLSTSLGSTDIVYPNSANGTLADYKMSVVAGSAISLSDVQQNGTLYHASARMQGNVPTADFTDAANHANYFQFTFPTTGYQQISLDLSMTTHNDVDDYLQVVYSTDGGSSWALGDQALGNCCWWTVASRTVDIVAKNKNEVIVRLIGVAGGASSSDNFYLDNFKVSGSSTTISDETATVTWEFDAGTADQPASYLNDANWKPETTALGSKYAYDGSRTDANNSAVYSLLKNTSGATSPVGNDAGNAIDFAITPVTALEFLPTSISFNCQKFGTGTGLIDVYWVESNGTATMIGQDINPNRDGAEGDGVDNVSIDLSTNTSITKSAGENKLILYIHSLGAGKQVGIGDVVISGLLNGTIEDVVQYTVSTSTTPTEGGTVTSDKPATVDAGTVVNLTAHEAFGYDFAAWIDGEGNILSTDNPIQLTVEKDSSFIASFTQAATYSLNISVEGGGNDYMVTASPNDNNMMYEAGDVVTLKARSNDAVSFSQWSTGETNAELQVTISGNTDITATFSTAKQILAGWDFVKAGNNDRPADFSSANNSGSLLSMRTADGMTSGWLDFSYEKQANGWYGQICAIRWKSSVTDAYYFQTSFDATGYENIQVQADMLGSYSYYDVQQCEYSLDGTNWTSVGSYSLAAANTWYSNTFTLPADANDAAMVYVRWIADNTSTAQGSGNDGTSISEVYISADTKGASSKFTLTTAASPSAGGTIAQDQEGSEFDSGTALALTASANDGYEFSHWESTGAVTVSSDNPLTVTIVSDTLLTAIFNATNEGAINAATAISWPFTTGEAGQLASFADGTDAYFTSDWVEHGSNLYYAGARTDATITYTQFNPIEQTGTATDIDLVSFNVRPKTGLSFVPASISFDAIRVGTGSGWLEVYWKSADGTKTLLVKDVQPIRNGSGEDAHFSFDLSGMSIPASGGDCALYVYIYNLGNTKQVGLANIEINGQVSGTIADIASYNLNASVSPEGAGTISTLPVGTIFDEGTEITIAPESRSFGYQFKEWQDANGTVLSSDEAFTFNIASDTNIVAVYEALTTYNFNVEVLGSNWGVVSLSPEPTNGKYEAGTNVVMEIVPNPVTSFSFWEDNSTETKRTVVVDSDKAYSATFDEVPFIVGWDFQAKDPTSSRGGDYYSVTSNVGLLNAYNQDGTVAGWLGHPGGFTPKLPCAYLWTVAADFAANRRYFESVFSTVGYTNIEVKSQMAGAYQHYLTQKMQVSVDGTNFTDLNTVNLSGTWADLNATLPTAYEGKEKVYIRWIADTNSELKGATSENDGTAITNIFVFADKEIINDDTAPSLVSQVPQVGSATATANGSIVLTFDERMKAGTGDITLGSTVLKPTFGSKTVTFPYSGLEYNTEYTVTVPDGALTDMAGNTYGGTTFKFSTIDRPVPSAKIFDAIVALDGSGDHTSIQEAIDAVPVNNAIPYLIFIKNGVYKGHVEIPASKPYVHLIGQERDSVVITDARLAGGTSKYPDSTVYHVSQGATAVINASDCYFENITFENEYGYVNLDGPQALALYTNNDKIILKNCWLRSYQDTYLTSNNNMDDRHYLQNCRIEGAVDFIYGGGDVFFDESLIYVNRPSGGYIVAPNHREGTEWGYVFSNCTIDGKDPSYTTYFGRPWHNAPKTSFFNTTVKINIYPVGWYYKMNAIPAIFADYNTMDANGNPMDLSQRIDTYEYDVKDEEGNVIEVVTGTAKNSFTDEEAAAYTYENVTSGTDGWNPRLVTESTIAPAIELNAGVLSWSAVDYAICYVITKNHKVVSITTDLSYTDADYIEGDKSTYQVQAAGEFGALSVYSNKIDLGKTPTTITWSAPEAITYGTALSATQLNASAEGNTSSPVYNPALGTVLNAGTHDLMVTFPEDADYNEASKTVQIIVNKATPVITWETPADIVEGTALSATQLNASAEGNTSSPVYSPALGTVLDPGTHTLNVTFAADNNYEEASASITINVVADLPTAVEDVDVQLSIIYPNPVMGGKLNIQLSNLSGNAVATLSSIEGKELISQTLTSSVTALDLPMVATGVYILKVVTDTEEFVQRVIIK